MSRKLALIIANTEYTDPGLAQLTAPGKDAEDFARVLKDPEICAFDDVKILLNERGHIVREAIDEFFDQKKLEDLLLLYFSGHGVRDEFGAFYLAIQNTNRNRLRATGIKSDFIRELMDRSHSKRKVLILDCINSEVFAQGTIAATGVSLGTATAFGGFGSIVLTASDSTQFAWEGDQVIGNTKNSLFTHFLVEGLEGKADRDGDGHINVGELYDYAFEQVRRTSPKQTPSKFSEKQQGEIVLRQITHIEDIKSVALPDDLISEIENSRPYVRATTVQKLGEIIKGKNLGMARSAKEILERLVEEEKKRLAAIKTESNIQKWTPYDQFLVKQSRILEAAIEKKVVVGKPAQLFVFVRRLESKGIVSVVKFNIDEEVILDEDKVKSREFQVEFPIKNGSIVPAHLRLRLIAQEFNPHTQERQIFVPYNGDSEVIDFIVTPLISGPLILQLEVLAEEISLAFRTIRTTAVKTRAATNSIALFSMPMIVFVKNQHENNISVQVDGNVIGNVVIGNDNQILELAEKVLAEKSRHEQKAEEEQRKREEKRIAAERAEQEYLALEKAEAERKAAEEERKAQQREKRAADRKAREEHLLQEKLEAELNAREDKKRREEEDAEKKAKLEEEAIRKKAELHNERLQQYMQTIKMDFTRHVRGWGQWKTEEAQARQNVRLDNDILDLYFDGKGYLFTPLADHNIIEKAARLAHYTNIYVIAYQAPDSLIEMVRKINGVEIYRLTDKTKTSNGWSWFDFDIFIANLNNLLRAP